MEVQSREKGHAEDGNAIVTMVSVKRVCLYLG